MLWGHDVLGAHDLSLLAVEAQQCLCHGYYIVPAVAPLDGRELRFGGRESCMVDAVILWSGRR